MNRPEALRAADWMIEYLRPACALLPGSGLRVIELAGSLRRGKKEGIDEIDLIAIPDLTIAAHTLPLFGEVKSEEIYPHALNKLLEDLQAGGRITIAKNGGRSKRFFDTVFGIDFDLYLVRPPATWGVLFAIRTGPAEFSHWFVTRRKAGGALPNGYRVQSGAVWKGEDRVPERQLLDMSPIGFETEESFFGFLGLDWIEPEDRVAHWGKFGGRQQESRW